MGVQARVSTQGEETRGDPARPPEASPASLGADSGRRHWGAGSQPPSRRSRATSGERAASHPRGRTANSRNGPIPPPPRAAAPPPRRPGAPASPRARSGLPGCTARPSFTADVHGLERGGSRARDSRANGAARALRPDWLPRGWPFPGVGLHGLAPAGRAARSTWRPCVGVEVVHSWASGGRPGVEEWTQLWAGP